MRAILVSDQGTTEVSVDNLDSYYKHLNCSTFAILSVEWDNIPITIYVDDEGLYMHGNTMRYVADYPDPLAGNILVLGGADSEGNTLPCPKSITIDNVDNFIVDVYS